MLLVKVLMGLNPEVVGSLVLGRTDAAVAAALGQVDAKVEEDASIDVDGLVFIDEW
jgi:hypothetical protein